MDGRMVESVLAAVEQVPDPRREHGKRHALVDILAIVLCAVIADCEDFVEIEEYARTKEPFFRRFLKLSGGIPSHDTFNRVMCLLSPRAFEECMARWLAALRGVKHLEGQHVAIDGKTLRGTFDAATGRARLHLVSAWAAEHGLTLGQEAVEEKSNEITAIPALLDRLELAGATVTIDAMGCQQEIAAKIRDSGADYVLAVKGNQEQTYQAVVAAFTPHLEADGHPPRGTAWQTSESAHGRREFRDYRSLPAPEAVRRKGWRDVRSIGMVYTRREEQGRVGEETRYYISSHKPGARKLARAVRSHWAIENQLHWTLDVAFREDACRTRTGHAAENLALINRLAVSLLRQNRSIKAGVKCKRKRAGWNDDYLLELLTQT